MNQYVVFENQGEIDPLAVSTFGVSVKESENPIGFFGTGLKYAIAILLRTHHEVVIQSGEEIMRFGLRPTTIRGRAFDLVTVNDQSMGFTSDVGKTWDVWMAYREIYCNCRDEDGGAYSASSVPAPEPGVTRVTVRGHEFSKVHANRDHFILSTEAVAALDGVDVHPGENRGSSTAACWYTACRRVR